MRELAKPGSTLPDVALTAREPAGAGTGLGASPTAAVGLGAIQLRQPSVTSSHARRAALSRHSFGPGWMEGMTGHNRKDVDRLRLQD
jgi:hypothetical protein